MISIIQVGVGELPLTKYIVVSFLNATLVLSVGETVEEVTAAESGFIATSATLQVQLLANGSVLQVCCQYHIIYTCIYIYNAKL
jgi:Mono-functional DNA-alkylating methyl methanesulfonate N-term